MYVITESQKVCVEYYSLPPASPRIAWVCASLWFHRCVRCLKTFLYGVLQCMNPFCCKAECTKRWFRLVSATNDGGICTETAVKAIRGGRTRSVYMITSGQGSGRPRYSPISVRELHTDSACTTSVQEGGPFRYIMVQSRK